jgi:hypothetical protein
MSKLVCQAQRDPGTAVRASFERKDADTLMQLYAETGRREPVRE